MCSKRAEGSEETAAVEVRLLGSPAVMREGVAVSFDTRKALALLGYICVEPGPHPRERLASFFWPDGDLEHSRGALRRTLSSLKSSLGEEGVAIDRTTVVRGAGTTADVDASSAFLQQVEDHHRANEPVCADCRAALDELIRLHSGPFMAGFSLKGVAEFDDWRTLQEEIFRKHSSKALRYLTATHEADGDFAAAVRLAERWVGVDPLHEPAHVALMRSLALGGDRDGALERYRGLVRILDDELGVAPLEDTVLLQDRIARGALEEAVPEATGGPRQRFSSPVIPFVGREQELKELAGVFSSRGVVAVEGEAGIGKTRLVREAARRAAATGAELVEVPSHEEERDHPYGLVARLLTVVLADAPTSAFASIDDTALAEAARLGPDLRAFRPRLPEPGPLSEPGAKTVFFEGMWETLAAATTARRPILLLEDLHWSDPTSLDFLSYVLRRADELSGAIVMTWRREDVGRDHRLRRIVAELTAQGRIGHIVLGRLDRSEVSRIVTEVLPDVDESVAGRLFGETEGVPFYVSEYVGALLSEPTTYPELPRGAEAMVRARIDPITGTAGQLLTAASVLGRSFDFALVQATAGRSDEETVDALEELVARGLLAEPAGARQPLYDFTHEKIRALVYEETSLARRRLLHGRAADHVVRPGAGDVPGDLSLAAYHCERAGRDSGAAELHLRAGDHARSLFANSEALAHYEAALALGHPDTGVVHESMGDMQVLLGSYEAALQSYEAAAAHLPGDRTARIERKLAGVRLRRGELESARAHLERALAGSDGSDRGRVLADLGFVLIQSDHDRAEATLREALDIAEEEGDETLGARCLSLLGLAARRSGRLEEARITLERSLEIARSASLLAEHVAAANNLALLEAEEGRVDEAITLTEEALALCRKHGDLHRRAALHNNLADLLHRKGLDEGSREHAKAAAGLFARVGDEPVTLPEIWKQTEW